MDPAVDFDNTNAASSADVLSRHVQKKDMERRPTPPSREHLYPRINTIDEAMEYYERFHQRTAFFDNWSLQFIYNIFDAFRLQYRMLVTHWSEYQRWEVERQNLWGNWEGQIGFQDDSPDPKWRAKIVGEVKELEGMDMGFLVHQDQAVWSWRTEPPHAASFWDQPKHQDVVVPIKAEPQW
ncbi:hypothetical protein BDP55DRAFT_634521 [Colletotrichum godetiae]|uniref:Uncharacterized protein n=1 Tax=Colletotrichum godetiae TaxID=1209918 RepID=A0AAJ0AIE5_9PEZI|nr:uncharacterized protein BDP55DRAFT_634521 [Colletotrichum godetiae]KAK1673018.1 hypothetical protein BDP55DRAFT_634521 [Colletotrichum godetiae]